MAEGKDLLRHVAEELEKEYGPQSLAVYPEGLRLEMHPAAWRLVFIDQDLWQFTSLGADPVKEVTSMTGIPLSITRDLEPFTWRLVIVTEQVLSGGTLVPR